MCGRLLCLPTSITYSLKYSETHCAFDIFSICIQVSVSEYDFLEAVNKTSGDVIVYESEGKFRHFSQEDIMIMALSCFTDFAIAYLKYLG